MHRAVQLLAIEVSSTGSINSEAVEYFYFHHLSKHYIPNMHKELE